MSVDVPEDQPLTPRDILAVFGAVLGAFMAVLDIQITNSALKDIQGGIAASLDEGSWISTGYLMAEIVIIPLTGFMCRVFSTRRYLITTCVLFVVFSFLCANATSLAEMIVWRVGQGLTGGALIPLALTIILQKMTGPRQPIGMAMFGFTATFAPAIGPTIGGWLTDTYGWEYIFYINVVPGALLVAIVWYAIDQEKPRPEELKRGDYLGILLMAVGFACMISVLEEGQRQDWFTAHWIRWATLAAAVCIPALLVRELTAKNPFIDLRLLVHRNLGPGCVMALALGVGLYGSVYIIPLYLQQIQGYNALQTGEALMWAGLPQLPIIPLVPLAMRYVDWRLLVAFGFSLFGVSCLMNGYLSPYTAEQQLWLPFVIRAIGQPFMIIPLTSLATSGIPERSRADASALFNMLRNLGGSIGTAMISTLSTHREQFHYGVISERITPNTPRLQDYLQNQSPHSLDMGVMRLLAQLQSQVRLNAYTMAYADCFFLMGMFLFVCIAALLIVPKPKLGAAAPAH